jgi:hypothetical protein
MTKLFRATLIKLLACLLFSFNSCTVYYKTSDIDSKISDSVQSANSTCTNLLRQISAFENDYKNLNCLGNSSPYSDAILSMNKIDKSKRQLELLQVDINKIQSDFKSYTKGKEKIASRTSEWSQFKTTKKSLKLKFKELQKIGEKTVEEAEEFSEFVNEKIVPLVKMVSVETYTKGFTDAEKSLVESEKELDAKLVSLDQEITAIKSKMARLNKDKFELLEKDIAEMKIQRNELAIVHMNLTKAIDLFKQQMNGKSKIYSCSVDWQIIESAEKSFGEQQAKFNVISLKITGIYAHMQALILEIK